MKIDSTTNNTTRLVKSEPKEAVSKNTEARDSASAPVASSNWQPSSKQDSSQDIDTARVAEIRQAISEGRLEISADKIADGIIASARELLADNK